MAVLVVQKNNSACDFCAINCARKKIQQGLGILTITFLVVELSIIIFLSTQSELQNMQSALAEIHQRPYANDSPAGCQVV